MCQPDCLTKKEQIEFTSRMASIASRLPGADPQVTFSGLGSLDSIPIKRSRKSDMLGREICGRPRSKRIGVVVYADIVLLQPDPYANHPVLEFIWG